jgi:hypothetical protein
VESKRGSKELMGFADVQKSTAMLASSCEETGRGEARGLKWDKNLEEHRTELYDVTTT